MLLTMNKLIYTFVGLSLCGFSVSQVSSQKKNFKTVIHHTLKFLNKVVFQILKYASCGFIFGGLVKGIQISFGCSINKEQRTLRNGGLHSVLGMDRERCLWREMLFQDGHVRAEKVRK